MKMLFGKLYMFCMFALIVNCAPCSGEIMDAAENEVESTKYEVPATVTDIAGKEYKFLKTQTNTSFIDSMNRLVATIEKDGVYYLCDFAKINSIERLSKWEVKVQLRTSKEITGNWICNDRTTNFYMDENNRLQTGYIYGIHEEKPSKIEIEAIKKIVFEEVKGAPESEKPKYPKPKKVELKNGTSCTTDCGYVIDFCGHYWGSNQHIRMLGSCETMKDGAISLDDVAEITFTGNFDPNNHGCREIVIKYKDGREQKEYLFLTDESYGGVCNHSGRFSYFDKMYLWQDFGAVLVPLDLVKTVVPNPKPETKSETPKTVGAAPDPGFCKGVNYISWTTGDYPYSTSWKHQTYKDSQAIIKTEITNKAPFKGNGSLELTLDVRADSETNRQGEVFVDLRYAPHYKAISPFKVKRYPDGKPIGVDLSGKTFGAVVFCEKGTAGSNYSPNGLQLFMKSVELKDGKEVWSSYYGNWHNIWIGQRGWTAAKELGDVRKDEWSLVTLRVPMEKGFVKPIYGYADSEFNPKNVALIGLKYGLNRNVHYGSFSNKILVDDFGWKDIVSEGDTTFEFFKIDHPLDVNIWEYFGSVAVPPLVFEEGVIFKNSCTFKCVGNSVFFDFEDVENPIVSLKNNGFNMVAVVNTEYMDGKTSTDIGFAESKSHSATEMVSLIETIHTNGMKVLLKPHVDVKDDSWRGAIGFPVIAEEKAKWANAWFISYTDFIVRYAKMAEAHKVEMLAIGTEFKSLNGSEYRQQWENVIKSIRAVYSGILTYAANWDDYENVCFWDLVDVVGIDAYFPISAEKDPQLEELVKGWSNIQWNGKQRNWVEELDQWQKKVGKYIIFTEIGYRSTDYTARAPWEYKEDRPLNLGLQARCYKAVIDAFQNKPWFRGVFFWYWSPMQDTGGDFDTDFTPQHKPAEKVFVGSAK